MRYPNSVSRQRRVLCIFPAYTPSFGTFCHAHPVCAEKSDSAISVVKSAEDRPWTFLRHTLVFAGVRWLPVAVDGDGDCSRPFAQIPASGTTGSHLGS